MLFILILLLFFFKKVLSCFFFKKLFLSLLSFLCVFWLYSIFVYVYSSNRSSRFVSSFNRFWRRSSMLLWVIELYLFAIYCFLIFNCPTETEWLADQTNLNYIVQFSFYKLFKCVFFSWVFFSIIFFSWTRSSLNFITSIILLSSLLCILLDEFYQFFFLISFLSYDFEYYSFLDKFWECSNVKNPSTVMSQYSFLLSFLKFWHILYIYIYFLLDFFFFKFDKSSRFRSLKYSLSNASFLILFCNTQLVLPLKYYMNFLYEQPYSFFMYQNFFNYIICI